MKYNTEKTIVDTEGNQIRVWDTVTIKYLNGGGCGGCRITKITDKGFRFVQGTGREKTVSYDIVSEIYMQKYSKKNRRYTGKCDISGNRVREGDIIESHIGGQINANTMVIKYGLYQAYCPVDKCYMDSVGFYASGKNLPDMPIGPLEDYALVIGDIYETPELLT